MKRKFKSGESFGAGPTSSGRSGGVKFVKRKIFDKLPDRSFYLSENQNERPSDFDCNNKNSETEEVNNRKIAPNGGKKRGKGSAMAGATALIVGSVIAKALGALYRVPLTNILGAEGMGMYQLVFPLFALFMTLSSAGIPTALSRVVAEKRALGENAKGYFVCAVIMLAALSAAFGLITFAFARKIAEWQGNPLTYSGFRIIAPTLVLVGLIAGFRGWFQGEMYMLPTAMSNIIEQLVKLVAGILLASALKGRGLPQAVAGALLGITLSEAAALLYLFVTYIVRSKKRGREKALLTKSEAAGLIKIALPIAVTSMLLPLSGFLDSIITVNMLKLRGYSAGESTAMYGILSGPVNSLVNMPIAVIMSLAVAVVPSVSASRTRRDVGSAMLKSRVSLKLAYLIGIPSAVLLAVFANRLLPIIYPALSGWQLSLAVNMLIITASNVALMSAAQIYISLIQALDKTKYAVLSLGFAVIVKATLNILLTRFIGPLGSAAASVIMGVVALAGVKLAYLKICGLRLAKNVGVNLVIGVIMMGVGVAISRLIKNNIAALVVGVVCCVAVYLWLALAFDVLGEDEINCMPMSRVLKKLRRLVRFWEVKDET